MNKRRIKKLLKQYAFLKWYGVHKNFTILESLNHKAKGTIIIIEKKHDSKIEKYYFNPPNKYIDIADVIKDLESVAVKQKHKQLELVFKKLF